MPAADLQDLGVGMHQGYEPKTSLARIPSLDGFLETQTPRSTVYSTTDSLSRRDSISSEDGGLVNPRLANSNWTAFLDKTGVDKRRSLCLDYVALPDAVYNRARPALQPRRPGNSSMDSMRSFSSQTTATDSLQTSVVSSHDQYDSSSGCSTPQAPVSSRLPSQRPVLQPRASPLNSYRAQSMDQSSMGALQPSVKQPSMTERSNSGAHLIAKSGACVAALFTTAKDDNAHLLPASGEHAPHRRHSIAVDPVYRSWHAVHAGHVVQEPAQRTTSLPSQQSANGSVLRAYNISGRRPSVDVRASLQLNRAPARPPFRPSMGSAPVGYPSLPLHNSSHGEACEGSLWGTQSAAPAQGAMDTFTFANAPSQGVSKAHRTPGPRQVPAGPHAVHCPTGPAAVGSARNGLPKDGLYPSSIPSLPTLTGSTMPVSTRPSAKTEAALAAAHADGQDCAPVSPALSTTLQSHVLGSSRGQEQGSSSSGESSDGYSKRKSIGSRLVAKLRGRK